MLTLKNVGQEPSVKDLKNLWINSQLNDVVRGK